MDLGIACRGIECEPWRGQLITDYHACAIRWADQISHRYPGEDFEPLVMSGLYLAAATWRRNGRGSFLRWFRVKVRGSTRQVLKRRRRWQTGLTQGGVLAAGTMERPRTQPIRLSSLSVAAFDSQFVYHDEDDEEILSGR